MDEKETMDQTVSVRRHGKGDLGTESIDDFIEMVEKEIFEKTVQD